MQMKEIEQFFFNQCKFKNIIKRKTCCKPQLGSCIDLIIASRRFNNEFKEILNRYASIKQSWW